MSAVDTSGAGEVGAVALLADKQKLSPARVVAREGSRFVLEDLGGQRFAVPGARLYWVTTDKPTDLAAFWHDAEQRAQGLDLESAWRELERTSPHPAGPATATSPGEVAAALGCTRSVTEASIVRAVFEGGRGFKVKDGTLWRESAAVVAEANRRRALEAEQKRALALASSAVARLKVGATLLPDEAEAWATYREALLDVASHGRDSERFALVQPLCAELAVHPDHAFDLLVQLGVLAPDDNLAPFRARLPIAFAPEVEAEAEERARYRPQPPLDLTHLFAVAIDDPETTEVDDAVALDGDRIHVFVADAAAYVQPGSKLDKAAMERTATVYLPEGKVAMVPPVLGEGPMSLASGEPRSALVFSFELGADGGLKAFEIQRARVVIAHRLTYTEVDAMLGAAAPDEVARPERALVRRLDALMERHRAYRHQRGAVTFQRPEVYYAVDPLGADDPPGTRRVRIKIGDPLGPARQLIAELMVAACSGAAIYCAERQIPCIYRTQAPPDDGPKTGQPAGRAAAQRAINPSTGVVDDKALQYELLRRMKPSVLSTSAGPHWTLAVPAYTQVTSPIRRYADLLMHQQLAAFLKTGRPAFSAARLDGHLADLARRQVAVRKVEQESRRFWALRYLEQNPGLILDGTVLRDIGKKTLVELAPIAIHELLQLRRRHPTGHRLRFEVLACSAREDSVTLKELV